MLYDRQATCTCGHNRKRHGYRMPKCYGRVFVKQGNRSYEVLCDCLYFQELRQGNESDYYNKSYLQLREMFRRLDEPVSEPAKLPKPVAKATSGLDEYAA